MSFKNKVVIITGASSGIGESTALVFTKEGANVVIVGRNDDKLKVVAAQCEEIGNAPLKIIADISNEEQAASIIDKTIDKYGKIDVLVNNAGIFCVAKITDGVAILKIYDEVMNINLRSAIHITTMATPHLIKTKGNVVNISSAEASGIKQSAFTPYTISKAGLDAFGKCAAIELAPYGVRVNTISPGPVYTDIWENSNMPRDMLAGFAINIKLPLDRISKPVEIANLILYLAGENAVGITGSNYVVDNGYNVS